MEFIIKVLKFLNFLDYDDKLSITNIGLIALITKMTFSPNMDWPSVVAAMTAFMNYAHKRSVNSQDSQSDTDPK